NQDQHRPFPDQSSEYWRGSYSHATHASARAPLNDALKTPNVSSVFSYGAVTGKFPNPRHVQDRLLRPSRWIGKFSVYALLRLNIGRQIRQMKILIALLHQRVINPPKQVWFFATKQLTGQSIHNALEFWMTRIVLSRLVGALRTHQLNILRLQPENEDI